MPVGLPGGDARPGIRLYHPREPGDDKGRTFRPVPDEDHLLRLARAGWVDTPRKLPGYIDPVTSTEYADEAGDYTEDALKEATHSAMSQTVAAQARVRAAVAAHETRMAAPRSAGEPSIDIRTIAQDESVAIIAKIEDPVILKKILKRERGSPKPKGGRRKVLDALMDRLAEVD